MVLVGASMLLVASPSFAQSASSSAQILSANAQINVPLRSTVNVTVAPVVPVAGEAAPNYDTSGSLLTFNQAATLVGTPRVGIRETLGTGLLATNANGSPLAAEATATIDDLAFGLDSTLLVLPVSLLKLSATTVQSYSQANSVGGLDASGHTAIEGLKLSGSALGNFIFDSSLFVNPAPNTVVFSLAGLSIVLNEQVASGDGVTFAGIQTNAIAVRFNNFALGTGLANGSIIIGHTQATAVAGTPSVPVPEPAAWAVLLLGFGAIGCVLRGRQARSILA